MIRIDHTVQIGRPRDQVFDFLTDVDNIPKWQSRVIKSTRLSEGQVRAGFQFEETAKVGPWKLHSVCTVTDMKPNERFAFESKSSGPLEYGGNFNLQPVAGGTRLTLTGTARLKGLWRPLEIVLGGDLRKETRAEVETLKRILEGKGAVLANGTAR